MLSDEARAALAKVRKLAEGKPWYRPPPPRRPPLALVRPEPPKPQQAPAPTPQADSPTAATTAAANPISGIIGRRADGTPLMRQGIPLADGTWLTESEAETSKQAHLARHLSKHPAMFERMAQKRGRKWANDMRQLMEAQR